ncbi:uncharacterized protein NECHADRAFT_98099 [Fusarium vanettenii 77-13-4]|uniref:PiggyBac transposable element-derived protein domain-containing protein n=1 Tax=Fusarium vanettenii (strain ATCC MYA-4622 / CBS 123669 / FGSC 9596 / NRRL 45880 / 77-13-4) TaxID=660122 RepID=C7ZM84_FUSV7|nr:uncharacterized protein NECHADRAFT_98099 [Fusarium vanettenii 77-13-4]EEU34869.1 hypothetical protein NECHADRAFT_98099 [Fusarium vanettenii 77-13-4]
MTSQAVPIEMSAEALNAYDDKHEGDSTRRPAFPPVEDRGFDFQPFQVPRRELVVKQLPQNPLSLFQHFIPISLVNSWVKYTNDRVNSLLQSGVIDSQEHEITEKSRLRAWKPTTAAEIYIWLGILIYIGVHGEISRPEHSIIKFMTYDRFQLLHRHLRLFDHTKFTDDDDFPIVFQCVELWSQHIQLATTELCNPGSHLAVDEGMIRYTGRNKQVTYVPNKPIDIGLKVWIAAQLGLFTRWIWHQPGAKYGPVGVERKKPASQRGRRKGKGRGSQRRTSSAPFVSTATVQLVQLGLIVASTKALQTPKRPIRQGSQASNLMRSRSSQRLIIRSIRSLGRIMPSYCSFQPSLLAMRDVIVGGRDRQRIPQWHGQYSDFFSGEPVKLISIPTIAASYNDEMNHVDRGDQRRSYLGYDHPIRRGAWQAIAWTFLLDVVLPEEVEGVPIQRGLQDLPSAKPVKADFSSRRRIYARGTT